MTTIDFEQIRMMQAEARRCAPKETIYALYASDFPDVPRYVGRTTHLGKRFQKHRSNYSTGAKKLMEWKKQLACRGAQILVKVLDEGIHPDKAPALELEWIKRLSHYGLLNTC